MSMQSVTVDEKKGILTIVMNLEARPSKSGKTTVVASTNGNIQTQEKIKGLFVTVGVNAYVRR